MAYVWGRRIGIIVKNSLSSNLFDSLSNSDEEADFVDEYGKDFELNTPIIAAQERNNQTYNQQKNVVVDVAQIAKIALPEKKIEKIMVFYSDNTFEVFEK